MNFLERLLGKEKPQHFRIALTELLNTCQPSADWKDRRVWESALAPDDEIGGCRIALCEATVSGENGQKKFRGTLSLKSGSGVILVLATKQDTIEFFHPVLVSGSTSLEPKMKWRWEEQETRDGNGFQISRLQLPGGSGTSVSSDSAFGNLASEFSEALRAVTSERIRITPVATG